MKRLIGWPLFASVVFGLAGAASVTHQRGQASRDLLVAVNAHNAPRVEALLNQGADPNIRDWRTYYPGRGVPFRPPWYEKYLAKLMRRPPRLADPYIGPTALMIAAFQGDANIVRSLLDHGADPAKLGIGLRNEYNQTDPVPVSPLWLAVNFQHTAAALLLITRGAPVNTKFSYGATPLVDASQPEIIEALVNQGADVNAADDMGNTALGNAVRRSDCCTTRLLLKKRAHIEAKCRYGGTPLMIASTLYPRLNPTLPVLLGFGANVNAHDRDGRTALINAAEATNLAAMSLLLSHGAEANAQDDAGETALMWVSYNRSSDGGPAWKTDRVAMRKLLRRYGANPTVLDKKGKTAADHENEDDPDRPAS